MRFALAVLVLAACGERPLVSAGSGELQAPTALSVPATALGFSRRAALTVTNRSRLAVAVEVQSAPPFSTPTALTLPPASDVELEVTFTPTALGPAQGTVLIDGWAVAVSSEGVAALACEASSVCETSRFDPETNTCLREVKADGTACEDRLQCLENGVCQAGACRGQAARCDDGNACTNDACAVGVGCQHVATMCEAPVNPCLAPVCDPARGCATTPVQDGTPCGAVSCELANVCLAGTCRAVTPPEGFTCAPESPCRGEGVCRARRCVQPEERALRPRWSYTSYVGDFRFDGVTDADGHWYWVECGVDPQRNTQPGHRCVVVSRTREGLERFATEVRGPGVLHGTLSGTQVIADGHFLFVTNETTLAAVTTSTGAAAWTTTVTTLPTPGFRGIDALLEDGRGQVWAHLRAEESRVWREALVRLDARTGQVRGAVVHDAQLRGFVLDAAGRLFCARGSRDPMTGRERNELLRLEPDGRESLRLTLPDRLTPTVVTGDRLVFDDDSVRSTADGRELEAANPGTWWPARWGGVAEPSGSRFRLGEYQLDDRAPTIGLTRIERGTRTLAATWTLNVASELHLTARGDALVVTTQSDSRSAAMRDTRLRQVHARGLEVMSCPLVDDVDLEPGGAEQPLQLGPETAFTGRWLAVRTVPVECPVCAVDLWAPPRVVFYDLGPNAPGLAPAGWVSRRGVPSGGGRPR
ncbi:MAG: hypothetical protein SFW67_30635 [Myxococcaceae bacterium]|nr:hypothetical protein [Myxococcaceae bacterium]